MTALELLDGKPHPPDRRRNLVAHRRIQHPAGREVNEHLQCVAQVLGDRLTTLPHPPIARATPLDGWIGSRVAPAIGGTALASPPVDDGLEAVHPHGAGHVHAANLRRSSRSVNAPSLVTQVACSVRPVPAFPTGGRGVHLVRRMTPDPPGPPDKAAERHLIERYLGKHAPKHMSRWTAELRQVLRREHKRRFQRYQLALGALAVIGLGALAYGYVQQRRVERAKRVAADVFYSMKSLELAVSHLQLTAVERASNQTRRADLAARYREYLEDLGIYGPETPLEVQLIYRTAHLFGESEINMPGDFVQEVRRFIDRWKGSPRLADAMARAAEQGYGPRIAEIMLANDMPPEFFYLALQESGLRPDAVGPRTRSGIAKGMWQFMPATARAYGLQTGPLVGQPRPDPADERQDFEKATAAAAHYLRDLYSTDAQASGLLVIAAYNWGETNLLPLIRSLPANPRERNFWQLLTRHRAQLPRQTYNYVLAVVSAAVIGQNPKLFGFDFPPPVPSHVGDVAEPGS